jgi:hypothetical protein
MKFLIIEDDDYKKNKIVDCINEVFSGSVLKFANSVNSAVIKLGEIDEEYIVLLDMSLPTYDLDSSSGGKPQGFGGKEILRNMEFFEQKNKVIVVTQYESIPLGGRNVELHEIQNDLLSEFEGIFHALIHFSVISDAWKNKLIESVRELNVND